MWKYKLFPEKLSFYYLTISFAIEDIVNIKLITKVIIKYF